MSAQIAASRGPRSSTWASGRSTKRHRPTTPAGVTLSLSEASAWSSTRVQVPAAAARSAYCPVAVAVAKTSTTHPGTERAPSTAFGPSARKSRRSVRTERRLSLRASLTRALPTVRGFRDRRCAPSSTTGLRGDLGRVDVLGQGGLGGRDERVERGDVVDGQVGEDLAVDLDARQVQALDEAVVGQALGASRSVDALDPQLAEVALVLAPVVVAVDQRVGDLLLRLAVEARALAPVTAGALEDYPALLLGVHCPLDACHCVTPSNPCDAVAARPSNWVRAGQRPSIFLARDTSLLASSTVPLMRRVTLEGFFSRLWRLPAFSRRILPEPVTRKRLLAPECVLFFGISRSLFSSFR